jgi:hypothetical protein
MARGHFNLARILDEGEVIDAEYIAAGRGLMIYAPDLGHAHLSTHAKATYCRACIEDLERAKAQDGDPT